MTDANRPNPLEPSNETPIPPRPDSVTSVDWRDIGVSASAVTSAASGPTPHDTTAIRAARELEYTKPDRPRPRHIRVRVAHDPTE